MADFQSWRTAFGRQADADFHLYQRLCRLEHIEACHRLRFLQSTCENLVKAVRCRPGAPRPERSHAVIRKHLGKILVQQYQRINQGIAMPGGMRKNMKQLIYEISLLSPAELETVRPDNCEYPWEDVAGSIHSPLDHDFAAADPVVQPGETTFYKLLQTTIKLLAE